MKISGAAIDFVLHSCHFYIFLCIDNVIIKRFCYSLFTPPTRTRQDSLVLCVSAVWSCEQAISLHLICQLYVSAMAHPRRTAPRAQSRMTLFNPHLQWAWLTDPNNRSIVNTAATAEVGATGYPSSKCCSELFCHSWHRLLLVQCGIPSRFSAPCGCVTVLITSARSVRQVQWLSLRWAAPAPWSCWQICSGKPRLNSGAARR